MGARMPKTDLRAAAELSPRASALAVAALTGVAGLAGLVGLIGLLGLTACGGDDDPPTSALSRCIHSSDCGEGRYCSFGECVDGEFIPPSDGDGGPDDDGGDIDNDGGDIGPDDGPGDSGGDGGDGDAGEPSPCDPPCTGLSRCDLGTSTCIEPPLCVNAVDCVAPRACEEGVCRDGEPTCTSNADCRTGYACVGHSCNLCISDDHCTGDQTCNGGTGLCEEPAVCDSNDDCLPPHVCVAPDCVDPSCPSDPYEPNDTDESATNVQTKVTGWSSSGGSLTVNLCAIETDTFVVPAAAGDGIMVRATYPRDFGRLDMELQVGTTLLQNIEEDGIAFLSSPALAAANPLLRFQSLSGPLIPVAVQVSLTPGGFCVEDAFEPNDLLTEAYALTANPTEIILSVKLCDANEDWVLIPMSAGKTLTIAVDAASEPVAAAELYETDIHHRLVKDTSPWNKDIEVHPTVQTDYYLVLYRAGGAGRSDATITIRAQ